MADMPIQDRRNKLPQQKLGRKNVVLYTPELALDVCMDVAEGLTLTEACAKKGRPSRGTFIRWTLLYPDVAEAFDQARHISSYLLEDDALIAARKGHRKPGSTQKVRATETLINQSRWSAEKRNARVYGQRSEQNVVTPITIHTSLPLDPAKPLPVDANKSVFEIEVPALPPPQPQAPAPEKAGTLRQALEQTIKMNEPEKVKKRRLFPRYDPHRPTKRKLVPPDPKKAEAERQRRLEQKARKNQMDRERMRRWRSQVKGPGTKY